MDYNNIQRRLKLIYSSIDQVYDYKERALDRMVTEETSESLKISFYNKETDEHEVVNQINTIISNIANVKDCLKSIVSNEGNSPAVIELEINKSLPLQLILDLANQEKHGYPLTKIRRSGKDPLISNIGRVITASNKVDNITVSRADGSSMTNMMVKVAANITDSKGAFICKLDDLVDDALSDWEKIIKKYKA